MQTAKTDRLLEKIADSLHGINRELAELNAKVGNLTKETAHSVVTTDELVHRLEEILLRQISEFPSDER